MNLEQKIKLAEKMGMVFFDKKDLTSVKWKEFDIGWSPDRNKDHFDEVWDTMNDTQQSAVLRRLNVSSYKDIDDLPKSIDAVLKVLGVYCE